MKTSTLFLLLFISTFVHSQLSIVTTGLSSPSFLDDYANEIYLVEQLANRISKINPSSSNPTPIVQATFMNRPVSLRIYDSTLYFFRIGGADTVGVFKWDLNSPNPPSTSQYMNPNGYYAQLGIIDVQGDYIFLNTWNWLSALNRHSANHHSIDTATQVSQPGGLRVLGNKAYLTDIDSTKPSIREVDLSTNPPTISTIVSGLKGAADIELIGSYFYVSEIWADQIIRIDTSTNQIVDTLISGIRRPIGLLHFQNELYICENGSGNLVKYSNLSTTIKDIEFPNLDFQLYPNPVQDQLKVGPLKESCEMAIYDQSGRKVLQLRVQPNESIDVQHLSKGVYIIQLEGRDQQKFIKE